MQRQQQITWSLQCHNKMQRRRITSSLFNRRDDIEPRVQLFLIFHNPSRLPLSQFSLLFGLSEEKATWKECNSVIVLDLFRTQEKKTFKHNTQESWIDLHLISSSWNPVISRWVSLARGLAAGCRISRQIEAFAVCILHFDEPSSCLEWQNKLPNQSSVQIFYPF